MGTVRTKNVETSSGRRKVSGHSSSHPPMSSLLRLDIDVWGSLSVFLWPSDLPRLLAIGNRTLTHRLTSGIRSISLEWLSPHYIDLDQVFASISSFKHATSITFQQSYSLIRCWTPVNWTLLPKSLTSLSLMFLGAPSIFLRPEHLCSLFGSLQYLLLEDRLSGRLSVAREGTSKISFLGLPPTLLSLIICSRLQLQFTVDELESLPPNLQELELFFPVVFTPSNHHETLEGGAIRAAFPRLPLPLIRLELHDGLADHWFIRLADLPGTLETFQLEVAEQLARSSSEANDLPCTVIDLTGSENLINLTTLRARNLNVKSSEVMLLFPDSLTHLEVTWDAVVDDRLVEAIAQLGPKLTYMGHHRMTNELLPFFLYEDGPSFFPLVHSFDIRFSSEMAFLNLPDTLTHLTLTIDDMPEVLPLSVSSYRIMPPLEDALENTIEIGTTLPWTPQHLNLKELTLFSPQLNRSLPAAWYESLPPSLRLLIIRLNSSQLKDFLEYLAPESGTARNSSLTSTSLSSSTPSTCSRLPKLESFKNIAPVDWNCFDLLSNAVLPRLVMVEMEIVETSISDLPACMSTLEAVSSLKVEQLRLKIHQAPSVLSPTAMVIPLLNHLPRGLTALVLKQPYDVKPNWPVKLPNALLYLSIQSFAEIYNGGDLKIEKESAALTAPEGVDSFQFPPLLVYLELSAREAFPIATLPPYLSICCMGPNQDSFVEQIFMNKIPPSASQKALLELNFIPE